MIVRDMDLESMLTQNTDLNVEEHDVSVPPAESLLLCGRNPC